VLNVRPALIVKAKENLQMIFTETLTAINNCFLLVLTPCYNI